MKIAIVSDRVYPFYFGGYEYSLYKYAQILSKSNEVFVFTAFDDQDSETERFNTPIHLKKISNKIEFVNKKDQHSLIGGLRYWLSLTKHKNELRGFDIVILNSIPYVYSQSFLRFLKRNNRHLVVIFYEAWHNYLHVGERNIFLRETLRRRISRIALESDFIISISKSTTKSLIENYFKPAQQIFTLPIGIEENNSLSSNVNERKNDIVFVGRLAKIKRIRDVLRSVQLLKLSSPDVKFAIVGDGRMISTILTMVEELGIKENVQVLGRLDGDAKLNILGQSKIFVLPSEREGLSVATLEAMYMGCVPIVSHPPYEEVFGPSHYIVDGVNGIFFPLGDIPSLTKRIKDLLGNDELLSKLSENAKRTASKYTWDKIAVTINETFEKIIS